MRDLRRFLPPFGFENAQIQRLVNNSRRISLYETQSLAEQYHILGFGDMTVSKVFVEGYPLPIYHIYVVINPRLLIDGYETMNLFESTPENIEDLCNTFRSVLLDFSRDEDFNDLRTWKCHRVDYSHNFYFGSRTAADMFLALTKKTSRYVRRNPIPAYEPSTAEGNKSSRVIYYDKAQMIRDTYHDVPEEQMEYLLGCAENLIRFEYQCFTGKASYLKNDNDFENKSIIHYLNDRIAHDLLRKVYRETVGEGDFCTLYYAQKKIKRSALSDRKKKQLERILQLIAQARSLSKGRAQFIEGGHQLKRTDIVVEGCKETFNGYLNDLLPMNLNPVLIPREWSRDTGIRILHNPFDEL